MQKRHHDLSRNMLYAFEAERQRRHYELKMLLKRQKHRDTLVVMLVNQGYLNLFQNWLSSCDDCGIDVRSRTLIFAVDSDAAHFVDKLGFKSYMDTKSYGNHSKEAVKVFGDFQFRYLMFQKTAIVKDILDLGYRLLFQDVDVVWLKDPLPYFLQPPLKRFDAHFMYDGINRIHSPLHLNTGFFLMNPTSDSIHFWESVLMNYDLILECGSQQRVVNKIIPGHISKGLKLNVLPEKYFANGHLFSIESTEKLPKDSYVIHCSWTRNLQHKIQKYKLANLWYLDNF